MKCHPQGDELWHNLLAREDWGEEGNPITRKGLYHQTPAAWVLVDRRGECPTLLKSGLQEWLLDADWGVPSPNF